jgi:hypothetical protein
VPDCVVPGCPVEARNNLGIRLRRPDTSAIWAPNTEAYVCDTHAESGARIVVFYEATDSDQVDVHVHGATSEASRTTQIRHREEPSLASDLTERISDS